MAELSFEAYTLKYFNGDYGKAEAYLKAKGIVQGNAVSPNTKLPDTKPTFDFKPDNKGKGTTIERTTARTENLETNQFPENNKTYRLNQHIKNFKKADGFLEKAKVAVVDVFFGDWENIGGFVDGAFLK